MTGIDLALLGIIVVVAIIGVGWFIYEMRSEDDK
jgi:hypothetical protein